MCPTPHGSSGAVEGVDQSSGRGRGVGERLLDQCAHAAGGQGEADLLVQHRGAGDHGVVEAEREQFGQGGDDRGAVGGTRGVSRRVHDADEFDAVE